MSNFPSPFSLVEALQAEGVPVPDHCREARLVMATDSALVIQYEVLVTSEYLERFGRALVKVGQEQK